MLSATLRSVARQAPLRVAAGRAAASTWAAVPQGPPVSCQLLVASFMVIN